MYIYHVIKYNYVSYIQIGLYMLSYYFISRVLHLITFFDYVVTQLHKMHSILLASSTICRKNDKQH